jgi:hypothetical protein
VLTCGCPFQVSVRTPSTASFPIEQVKRCEKIFHLYDEASHTLTPNLGLAASLLCAPEDESGAFDKDEFKVLWGVLRFGSGRKVEPSHILGTPCHLSDPVANLVQVTDDEIDRIFMRFDVDRDGLLNMDEFINCIKRELTRKTGDRREDVFTLLERGMDGGKRLMKKAQEQVDEDDEEAHRTSSLHFRWHC